MNIRKEIEEELRQKVFHFKTKHKEGFTNEELKLLLQEYSNIDMKKFYDSFYGDTCVKKDGEYIRYHVDVQRAVLAGLSFEETSLDFD